MLLHPHTAIILKDLILKYTFLILTKMQTENSYVHLITDPQISGYLCFHVVGDGSRVEFGGGGKFIGR